MTMSSAVTWKSPPMIRSPISVRYSSQVADSHSGFILEVNPKEISDTSAVFATLIL